MPRSGDCRICERRDVASIDQRLGAKESVRALARELGIPRSTIRVHWERCRKSGAKATRPPKATPSVRPDRAPQAQPGQRPPSVEIPDLGQLEMPEVALPDGHPLAPLLRELRDVHAREMDAFRRSCGDPDGGQPADDRMMAVHVKELRNNLTAQASLLTKIQRDEPTHAERLAANPEWAAFRKRFLALLDRRPDLRVAVVEDLEAFLAEEAPVA